MKMTILARARIEQQKAAARNIKPEPILRPHLDVVPVFDRRWWWGGSSTRRLQERIDARRKASPHAYL